MVPGIGVECVCRSGAMLAKAGTVLDVCLVGGNRLRNDPDPRGALWEKPITRHFSRNDLGSLQIHVQL